MSNGPALKRKRCFSPMFCPSACILILSICDSLALIEEAKKVGIRGFCSKNAMDSFYDAVEAILRGEAYFLWGMEMTQPPGNAGK
jgi:DNA-binding NarL/FixJ family response regulator